MILSVVHHVRTLQILRIFLPTYIRSSKSLSQIKIQLKIHTSITGTFAYLSRFVSCAKSSRSNIVTNPPITLNLINENLYSSSILQLAARPQLHVSGFHVQVCLFCFWFRCAGSNKGCLLELGASCEHECVSLKQGNQSLSH
jgi:hypothetical protein